MKSTTAKASNSNNEEMFTDDLEDKKDEQLLKSLAATFTRSHSSVFAASMICNKIVHPSE